MRAVLDTNVLVSAVLSRSGNPARIMLAWIDGAFELVVSPMLLAELERVLAYPKIRARIAHEEAQELLGLLASTAETCDDPADPPAVPARDPGDDYLVALGQAASAVIVSGDDDLLSLADRIPVFTPAAFLTLIGED